MVLQGTLQERPPEILSLLVLVIIHSVWGASQVTLMAKNLPANAGNLRDTGSIPWWRRSPGGGHGNPLQYSCLENPMDRGAWRAIVHRVAKSLTQLKKLSTHNIFYFKKRFHLYCYFNNCYPAMKICQSGSQEESAGSFKESVHVCSVIYDSLQPHTL